MSKSAPTGPSKQVDQATSPPSPLAALDQNGADQFDPIRFHYLKTLAQRAQAYRGPVRQILEGKLAAALTDYQVRLEQAQHEARDTLTRLSTQHPEASDELQRLFLAGNFKALHHRAISRTRPSLAELTRHIDQHTPKHPEGNHTEHSSTRSELKAIRYFRKTWSRLSVDKQLTLALAQGPENAGPLNSHMLVLRSLALMRDISPDYLNQFVPYVDTLLWLEQADKTGKPQEKSVPKRKQRVK